MQMINKIAKKGIVIVFRWRRVGINFPIPVISSALPKKPAAAKIMISSFYLIGQPDNNFSIHF